MITTFAQVCPVFFGEDASTGTGEKIRELFQAKKAFCICDKGISDCGIADKIQNSLEAAGIDVQLFDEVLPEAPDTMVDHAANIARNFDADLVVGIGGGSSLDAAKAITILLDNPGSIRNYFQSTGASYKSDTPLVLIPTASGTGSEVTKVSVVYDHVTNTKDSIVKTASLAIVDPALTLGLPPFTTATTALDALAHATEAYTSRNANPMADALALEAIRLITSNVVAAYQDGSSLEARTNLSKGSVLAGIAFNDTDVHFGHAVAHEFGVQFHMPHGLACALTLPEVLSFAGDIIPQRSIDIAKAMGITVPEHCTGPEAAALSVARLKELLSAMHIPSLKKQGITLEAAAACAENAYNKNPFIACAPRKIDIPELKTLIADIYNIYQ